MTWTREQFREHVVDYLYDELSDLDRTEFERCLTGSEECRRELWQLQQTVLTARARLAADTRPAPRHVREHILAFADQHAQPPAHTDLIAHAGYAPSTDRAERRTPHDGQAENIFQRLIAWLISPAKLTVLSVAAVAALAVLSKQHTAPEQSNGVPQSGSSATVESPTAEAAPVPATASQAESETISPDDEAGSSALSTFGPFPGAAPSTDDKGSQPSAAALERREAAPLQTSPAAGANAARKRASSKPKPSIESDYSSPALDLSEGKASQAPASEPPQSAAVSGRGPADTYAPRPAVPAAPTSTDSTRAVPRVQTRHDSLARGARTQSTYHPTHAPNEVSHEADELMQAKRYPEAAVAYARLLAQYPKDPRAAYWRKQRYLARHIHVSDP